MPAAVQRDYDNAPNREQILAELDTQQEADQELPNISPGEAADARRTLAQEEAPDPENPRPDLRVTADVEFRGHTFSFTEIGDAELEAAGFQDIDEDDIEANTEAGEWIYETLGDAGIDTDEEYWRQYSLQPVNGSDGIVQLFGRVVESFNDDIDMDELEAAGNSP